MRDCFPSFILISSFSASGVVTILKKVSHRVESYLVVIIMEPMERESNQDRRVSHSRSLAKTQVLMRKLIKHRSSRHSWNRNKAQKSIVANTACGQMFSGIHDSMEKLFSNVLGSMRSSESAQRVT